MVKRDPLKIKKKRDNVIGPPVKEIDWPLFEQLCALQCTQEEMSGCLRISVDALVYKVEQNYSVSYSEIFRRFSSNGKCSLRRNQVILSKTNASMAIWLGKQWLGQKENTDLNLTVESQKEFETVLKNFERQQEALKLINIESQADSI